MPHTLATATKRAECKRNIPIQKSHQPTKYEPHKTRPVSDDLVQQ